MQVQYPKNVLDLSIKAQNISRFEMNPNLKLSIFRFRLNGHVSKNVPNKIRLVRTISGDFKLLKNNVNALHNTKKL